MGFKPPHKSLVGIFIFSYPDLSRPLADSEKLPVRSHRASEAAKSPAEDGDAGSGTSQDPKKKSSKEKREKKKDKDRDRKVGIEFNKSLR